MRNLAITSPHHCIRKPKFTAGISWAGQVKYIFHCHLNDLSFRYLYRHFLRKWRSVLAICSSARSNVIEYPSIFGNALIAAELSTIGHHQFSLKSFPVLHFRELQAASQQLTCVPYATVHIGSRLAVEPATFHEVLNSFIIFRVPTPHKRMRSGVSNGSASVRAVKIQRVTCIQIL